MEWLLLLMMVMSATNHSLTLSIQGMKPSRKQMKPVSSMICRVDIIQLTTTEQEGVVVEMVVDNNRGKRTKQKQ